MRFSFHVLMALASVAIAFPAAAAGGMTGLHEKMAPHKALYDIKMVSKRSGSQILNISGQMFYEWRPGCEAWTTDHRFTLLYEYADSAPIRITSDFATYETFDGRAFNFNSRRKRNGALYEEIRGNAAVDDAGAANAVFSIPAGLSFDLGDKTMFPMAHSMALLEAAQAGKKFYTARVFDGSDEDGPVEINAFIGKPVAAPAPGSDAVDGDLLAAPAWQMRMAFFPLKEPESDAEYEMDIVFHDNGVISDMLVEYRDFSVTQKLSALERLEKDSCGQPGAEDAPPAPRP